MPPTDQADSVATAPPSTAPPPAAGRPDVELVEYHDFVDQRIRRTRWMVKVVDAAQTVLLLLAGWVVLIAVTAVVEHWVAPGGLTEAGRYAVFGAAVAATIGLLAVRLAPLATRRVNPIYAADAIERTTPRLKNTLVNLLLLRGAGQQGGVAAEAVRQELEREAAERMVGEVGDSAVDHRGLIRLGCVLLGLLAAVVLYAALSPKNPFTTAARVLAPWADIAAPTRVRIKNVTPGHAERAQGESVTIAALVSGLEPDEQVWLVSSTPDRQQRERRLALSPAEGDLRFETTLPTEASRGLQQDLAYRIEAGDARSRTFRIRVVAAPTIVVRNVHYDYPSYTGYLDRDTPNTGDLRAIEGTRVQVRATANLPIDSAQVDFGGDGRPDVRMKVDGQTASAEFVLALRDDRRTPRHTSYVLRFATTDGRANNNPATHRIEVTPDLAPEVELVEPREADHDLRLDETLVLRLRARDPDFGLRGVSVRGERVADRTPGSRRAGRPLFDHALLREATSERFDGVYRLTPRREGLKVGDVVECWAAATDTRSPNPQVVESRRLRLRIVPEEPNNKEENRGGEQGAPRRRPDQQEQQDGDDGQGNDGRQEGQPQGGDQQRGGQQPNGQQADGQPSSDAAGGDDQQQQGDQQQGDQQQGDQQQGDQQQGDDQQQGRDKKGGSRSPEAGGLPGRETEADPNAAEGETGGGQSQPGSPDGPRDGSNPGGQADRPANPSQQRREGPRDSAAGGGGNGGSPREREEPVASDGENDGEAFERIGDFLRDRKQDAGKEKTPPKKSPQDSGSEDPAGGKQEGFEPSDATGRQDRARGDGRSEAPRDASDGRQPPGGDPEQQDRSSDAAGDQQPDGDAADRRPQDSGRDGSGQAPSQDNRSRRQTNALGGDNQQTPGGGEKGKGEQAPRDGTGSPGETNAADDGQGRSADRGAGDKTNAAGDRQQANEPTGNPGDGQPGDGSAERPGSRGSADPSRGGSNAGDSNAGDTEPSEGGDPTESGDGNPADRNATNGAPASDADGGQPGGSEQDGRPAGEPSADPSASDPSASDRSAGEPPQADGESPADGRSPTEDGVKPSQPGEGDASGKGSTPGGGRAADRGQADESPAPAGDDANLEYTRKQTDFVLDQLAKRLEDKRVERELLDELGWTEDELRRFVERWRPRVERAKRSPTDQAELDDDLRSLGLRPSNLSDRVERTRDNVRVGGGYRGQVPAAVRDRLRAYSQGLSRTPGDDG